MPEDEVRQADKEQVDASIIQVLQSIYTATRSVLIYPPENPTISNMIDSALSAVAGLVPEDGSLDISVMQNNKLIVNGEMLDDGLQKRRIVQNFVELVEARKLSSITFWWGLTKEELRDFLVLLATKTPPREDGEEHDIFAALEEQGVKHIEVDEQVYVAISRREKVVDARAAVETREDAVLKSLKDEVFARFISGQVSLAEIDPAAASELLADPEKMVALVQGVLAQQGWDAHMEAMPFRLDETRAVLERISQLIGMVEDPLVRSKLSAEVHKIVEQVDAPQLTDLLIASPEGHGEGSTLLPGVVMPLLGDVKLEGVALSAIEEYRSLSQADTGDGWPTTRMLALKSVLDRAMASASPEVAARLSQAIFEAGVDVGDREATTMSGTELAKALMSGEDPGLVKSSKGPALVVAATYLFENERDDLGSLVMEELAEKFMRQSEESQSTAAWQLWGLFKVLRDLGKETFAADLVDDVSRVVESASGAPATLSGSPGVAGLDTGGLVAGIESLGLGTGAPVSASTIERLMVTDTGRVVQAVFESGDQSAKEAISRALSNMGERAVPALVNTAQESTDGDTLQSVAETLSGLKADPVPLITARFSQELEPFQLVNLVRLTAMVGDDGAAPFLGQLLAGDDLQIKTEAVHALGALGGKQSLQVLLNASAEFDVSIKPAVVRELARFHDYMAVRRLLEILSPKKKGEMVEDEAVMIAACRALGELKVRQAVPMLAELAKGARRHEQHSDELRAAATASIGMIGGDEAAQALKKLLKDSSMLVRSTAKKALGLR